ncbi:MAG: hypothetical protein JKY60_05575 [Kordiimonadaceae bacterium]|nr:hypothetical protein [Kordiimonadaceae bacterium]
MKNPKRNMSLTIFRFGLLNVLAVALYHFVLPYQFLWEAKMASSPPIFSWALLLINFDWSLLTAALAVMLLYFSRAPEKETATKRTLTIGFVFCWIVHTIYLAVDPAAVPNHLAWINMIFVGFAALTTLSLGFGLGVFKPEAPVKLSPSAGFGAERS